MRKEYNKESWINPKVEVRNSEFGGKGLFAKETIEKDEIVIVWGGTLMTEETIKRGNYRKGTSVEIGEGMYFAGKPSESPGTDDFLNHSCDPNLWLKDEVTLIMRRDIEKDEELTADYGTWVSRPEWKMECRCGSRLCRKMITGNDWKSAGLQKGYGDHLSPYLKERIKKSA